VSQEQLAPQESQVQQVFREQLELLVIQAIQEILVILVIQAIQDPLEFQEQLDLQE
jgi:hypothetical protein